MQELHCEQYSILSVTNASHTARFNNLRLQLGIAKSAPIERDKRSWLSVDRCTGDDLGYINVVPFNEDETEIGFMLLPTARRKGVMTTLLPQFVALLRENLYTETSVENAGAINVLEVSGFTRCQPEHPIHVTPYGETVRTLAFRYAPSTSTH
jgi:RimJ/RimL family protein N-acetyltransferase